MIAAPPDLDQARLFLAQLDPSGRFTFQTFAEAKSGNSRPQIFHGSIDDCASSLTEMNQAGAGVFVMINKGDMKGRCAGNVLRVRALFVDLDGAPLEPVLEAAETARPHLVVESSSGRWHVYWLVDGCAVEDFKARQQALAVRFGGDPSVCDLPRVMRLPGFWHLKSEPFLTRLVD